MRKIDCKLLLSALPREREAEARSSAWQALKADFPGTIVFVDLCISLRERVVIHVYGFAGEEGGTDAAASKAEAVVREVLAGFASSEDELPDVPEVVKYREAGLRKLEAELEKSELKE